MKIVQNTYLRLLIISVLTSCLLSAKEFRINTTNTTAPASAPAPATAPSKSGNSTAANSTAGNSTSGNSTSGTPTGGVGHTNIFPGKANSSNALGHVGPANFSIGNAPYIVKSCDQVLLIPVKRIMNFRDYCQKKDGFFTMSVYMVNSLEAQDANKLVESITMDRLTTFPRALDGAPGCVDFQSATKRIAVCVANDEIVQQIIEAYKAFLRCRMGDNLRGMTAEEMWKILSKCSDLSSQNKTLLAARLGHFTNQTQLASQNVTLPSLVNKIPSIPGINPYYADLKVPGS